MPAQSPFETTPATFEVTLKFFIDALDRRLRIIELERSLADIHVALSKNLQSQLEERHASVQQGATIDPEELERLKDDYKRIGHELANRLKDFFVRENVDGLGKIRMDPRPSDDLEAAAQHVYLRQHGLLGHEIENLSDRLKATEDNQPSNAQAGLLYYHFLDVDPLTNASQLSFVLCIKFINIWTGGSTRWPLKTLTVKQLAQITTAYNILGDPKLRREYDTVHGIVRES